MVSVRAVSPAMVRWVLCAAILAAVAFVVSPAATAAASPSQDFAAEPLAADPTPEPVTFEDMIERTKASIMRAPEEAYALAGKSYDLASDIPPDQRARAQATALWLKAEAGLRSFKPDEGRAAAELALSLIAEMPEEIELRADILLARGRLASRQSETRLALSSYFEAYDLFVEVGDARRESLALQSLGSIYSQAESYDQALEYFRRAAEIYEGDDIVRLSIENNVGNILRDTGRLTEARKNFERAAVIAEALDSDVLIARVLINLARTELDLGHPDSAIAHITRASSLTGGSAGAYWQRFIHDVQAEIALSQGDLAEARAQIELALSGINDTDGNIAYKELHETGAAVYALTGEWERAYIHQGAAQTLSDEARSLTASANLALLGAQFQFAEQQLNIERLRIEKLESAAKLGEVNEQKRQQQIVILSGALVMLLALMGAFSVLMHQRRIAVINAELSTTVNQLSDEVLRRQDVERDLVLARDKAEEADRMKSIFLATMSHELRTPMNGILGFTEVLLAGDLTEEQREQVEIIDQSSGSLLTLINDILDLSQLEAGKFRLREGAFDLRVTAENALKLLRARAQEKHLSLICHIDPAIGTEVHGDEDRLRQIILNLVGNAIKFTEKGGVSLLVTKGERAGQVHFAVRDTGIGIPQDKIDLMFDRFSQIDGSQNRKYAGSGLGLAICKELVAAMNGEIDCISALGEGSTFWFTVDIEGETATATVPALHVSGQVIVVDALDMRRDLLTRILTAQGQDVIAYRSVEEVASAPLALASGESAAILAAADDEGSFWAQAETLLTASSLVAGQLIGIGVSGPTAEGLASVLDQPITDSAMRRALGAAFRSSVYIPPKQSSAMTSGQVAALDGAASGARVLVVDDVSANRKLVECILRQMGVTCVCVENGEEAVAAADVEDFDLVLMDVYMPIMGGVEAAQRIRQGTGPNKNVPIFALTASASAEERTDAVDAGMNGVLTKPLNIGHLKALVLETLNSHDGSSDGALSA